MALDPATTALVLIEHQDEFTTKGGVLHNAVAEVMDAAIVDEPATLTDCLAATSPEEHKNPIKFDYPMFSRPMLAAEMIAQLGS